MEEVLVVVVDVEVRLVRVRLGVEEGILEVVVLEWLVVELKDVDGILVVFDDVDVVLIEVVLGIDVEVEEKDVVLVEETEEVDEVRTPDSGPSPTLFASTGDQESVSLSWA